MRALLKVRPGHIVPEIPRNAEPRTGLSMGEHTAIMAKDWGITRARRRTSSPPPPTSTSPPPTRRASRTTSSPPTSGLERDQNLRPDTTVEKLGKLKPVFGGPDGTMTAGNSTPLSDGASAVLLGTEEWAAEHGLPVLARFVDAETAAVDHVGGRDGLLMAPAYAVPRMLARNGLTLQDFDLYEIHEAFAAQVLCTLAAWEDPVFSRERLGLDAAARFDRPRQAQRQGRLARRRRIRSPRPVAGSSATWRRCSPSAAAGAG